MKKLLLLIPLFCLCGCRSEAPAVPKTGMIANYPVGTRTLKYTITHGQEVKFRLAANPTTGYQWEQEGAKHDGAIDLQLVFIAPRANGMTGVPGFTEVTAKPLFVGQHEFNLLYRRPWEKEKPPAEIVTVKIRVLPQNK